MDASQSAPFRSSAGKLVVRPRHFEPAAFAAATPFTESSTTRQADPSSPILDVDHAKSIIVIKRSMGRGYAGIDNSLYTDPKTGMLFSDAKAGLEDLLAAVKEL